MFNFLSVATNSHCGLSVAWTVLTQPPLPAMPLWVSTVLNMISGLAEGRPASECPACFTRSGLYLSSVRGTHPGGVYHRWRGGLCHTDVPWAPRLCIRETSQACIAVFAQTAADPVALDPWMPLFFGFLPN